MFSRFEKWIHPYPEDLPHRLPEGLRAFIWACTQGARVSIIVMMLCTALIGAFEALLVSLLGQLIDWLNTTPTHQFWTLHKERLGWLAALLLLSPIVVALQTLLRHQTLSGNLPMRLRWHFHRLMLKQSMYFFQDEFSGRIAAKVTQTALAVRDAVLIVTDILVYLVIYFVSAAIVLAHFDPWLLFPFFIWLLLYGATAFFFVPRLGHVAKAQADARSLMTGRITDAYANIATVKLFSHAQREAAYARLAMQDFIQPVYAQQRLISGFEIINHTLNISLVVAIAWLALSLWTKGQAGMGAVAAATTMALRLNGISHWAMWELSSLFEQIGTVQDGIQTLTRAQQVADKPNAPKLVVTRGEICFDKVRFSYGKEGQLLENFSLTIRPGEKIALIGRSGAGKSTIINLLLRFYDVDAGKIQIDGQDIAQIQQESLRQHIAMVTQDTSLLHRSIQDNIWYGRPDASTEMLVAAAQHAEAHDFIVTLTDSQGRSGYLAHVGERGVKLSGGQRQRIAIARVILKDAPILLLDEATSALDSEVEASIQNSLYKLMAGKTVIAIAHRLSTIAAMDRLIVLDNGRIVEEGNHKTLLAKNGLYARLWTHQSGGFLGEA